MLPRGLPVGRAVKGLDGRWRVVLDADDSAIDWVRILKFKDYAQLADQKALAQTHLPPVITENPEDRIIGSRTPVSPAPLAKGPAVSPAMTGPTTPVLKPATATVRPPATPAPKAPTTATPARPPQ